MPHALTMRAAPSDVPAVRARLCACDDGRWAPWMIILANAFAERAAHLPTPRASLCGPGRSPNQSFSGRETVRSYNSWRRTRVLRVARVSVCLVCCLWCAAPRCHVQLGARNQPGSRVKSGRLLCIRDRVPVRVRTARVVLYGSIMAIVNLCRSAIERHDDTNRKQHLRDTTILDR